MKRQILPIVLLAAAVAAAPSPDASAGSFFDVSIGGSGFGVTFGASDWAPYQSSWHDPGWRIDLDVALGGYGEWVYVDGLGRVWRPWVASSWRPYTHGRWVSTAAGWTWISYEPWGYVPHHYGSWALTVHGWVWTPGWQYRPANVVWVGHGDWIGWYPCAPRGWRHHARGFDRGYHHGYRHGRRDGYRRGYGDGYDDGWRDATHATWTRYRDLGAANVSLAAGPPPDLGRAVDRGRVAVLREGPSPDAMRRTGARVPQARLERRTVAVDGRRVEIARPAGFADSIRDNAGDTVRRAMPELADQRRRAVGRTGLADDRAAPAPRPELRRPTVSSRSPVRADDGRRSAPSRAPDVVTRPATRSPIVHRSPRIDGTDRPAPPARRPAPTREGTLLRSPRMPSSGPSSPPPVVRRSAPVRAPSAPAVRPRTSDRRPPARLGRTSEPARRPAPADRSARTPSRSDRPSARTPSSAARKPSKTEDRSRRAGSRRSDG